MSEEKKMTEIKDRRNEERKYRINIIIMEDILKALSILWKRLRLKIDKPLIFFSRYWPFFFKEYSSL